MRPVLWLTSAAALAILLTLGTWQVKRLHWKTDLIAKAEARADAEPIPLAEALARAAAGEDVEYLPVRIVGGFPRADVAHIFGTYDGAPGFYVFQRMRLDDPAGRDILLNRGFVPQDARQTEYPLPDAEAVTGLLRTYEAPKGLAAAFAPNGQPTEGTFYNRDPARLAAFLSYEGAQPLLPFAVDSTLATEVPRGGTTRLAFRNAHLGYALTWYGLALGLVGVTAAMSRRR